MLCFFLKILWFFWTLPVLLQRWCSTCLVCLHTLTPRGKQRKARVRNILNPCIVHHINFNDPKLYKLKRQPHFRDASFFITFSMKLLKFSVAHNPLIFIDSVTSPWERMTLPWLVGWLVGRSVFLYWCLVISYFSFSSSTPTEQFPTIFTHKFWHLSALKGK